MLRNNILKEDRMETPENIKKEFFKFLQLFIFCSQALFLLINNLYR
jgi:hypothetical protein